MPPNGKTHESDWRKDPDSIKRDSGTCVATYQNHYSGCEDKSHDYGARKRTIRCSIYQPYRQDAAHSVSIGGGLHIFICRDVSKRECHRGPYLPKEVQYKSAYRD